MQLSDKQALFAKTILGDMDVIENPDLTLKNLFSDKGASIPDRLKIYRNNVIESLTSVLMSTYPLINELTGEDFSKQLMRAFLLENLPDNACLSYFGDGLPTFIKTFDPASSLPYLSDIASLEWAIHESYYATDDVPLDATELGNIKPNDLPDLHLNLRNSVKLITSKWPIISIRDFCLKEDKDQNETINLDEQGACQLIINRIDFKTDVFALTNAEYQFLNILNDGKCLGDALTIIFEDHASFNFQNFLEKAISLEIFETLQKP